MSQTLEGLSALIHSGVSEALEATDRGFADLAAVNPVSQGPEVKSRNFLFEKCRSMKSGRKLKT